MAALGGAAISAALPFLLDKLFPGQKASTEQVPTMTGGQSNLLEQLVGGLGGPLSQGLGNISQLLSGDPNALAAFQAPAIRQFKESIVPGIAERFSGADAQGSSAFTQSLGGAGAGLAESLSAQKAGLQQNAMQQLLGLLGQGLQAQPFAIGQRAATDSPFAGISSAIGGGFGQSFGKGLSGMGLDWLKNRGKNTIPGYTGGGTAV